MASRLAHDIVDVGEVAGLLAIAKDDDRLARRGGMQEPLKAMSGRWRRPYTVK